MSRFVGIPALPDQGLDESQYLILDAMKQNLELVTGTRGETDGASAAITKGSLTVSNPPTQQMTRVSATGAGVTISNVQLPTLTDYGVLLRDVQTLATDVANLRAAVDTLISQLRA